MIALRQPLFWLTIGYRIGRGSKHRWLAIVGTILWLAACSIIAVSVLIFVFYSIPAISSVS